VNPFDDRLVLRGMRFSGRHGVHPEEKERAQPFEVDLILHADLTTASASDDLSDTTDYGPLFELVRGIVEGRSFDLIEALAGAIADAALAETEPALVGSVEVNVRKPKAPLAGEFETVEVTIVRDRTEPARFSRVSRPRRQPRTGSSHRPIRGRALRSQP
jgi:dihydroneopterin aldolase